MRGKSTKANVTWFSVNNRAGDYRNTLRDFTFLKECPLNCIGSLKMFSNGVVSRHPFNSPSGPWFLRDNLSDSEKHHRHTPFPLAPLRQLHREEAEHFAVIGVTASRLCAELIGQWRRGGVHWTAAKWHPVSTICLLFLDWRLRRSRICRISH